MESKWSVEIDWYDFTHEANLNLNLNHKSQSFQYYTNNNNRCHWWKSLVPLAFKSFAIWWILINFIHFIRTRIIGDFDYLFFLEFSKKTLSSLPCACVCLCVMWCNVIYRRKKWPNQINNIELNLSTVHKWN